MHDLASLPNDWMHHAKKDSLARLRAIKKWKPYHWEFLGALGELGG